MRELCLTYGITLRNSCAYEPWQNGACERANATCGRIVREMMARAGGHGAAQLYQYWGYAWVYAATIANATFAVRDTGKSPVMHGKTKHILRKELKIRELVESGDVKVEYVESLKNFADFFTKPLPRKEFESFRKEIMNDTA